MKNLDLKALLYTVAATLGLGVVAFLGFMFPLPMLLIVGIVLIVSFAFNAYRLFSLTNKQKKSKNDGF